MKKLMIVAAIAFSAVLANAEYLYWQASATDAKGYEYAALYQDDTMVQGWMDIASAGATGTFAYEVNGGADKSYYIEYANYNSDEKSMSVKNMSNKSQTYSQLAANGVIIGTELPMTMAQVWLGGTSYAAAPEPTSALLVLFGLAGLALKRRTA